MPATSLSAAVRPELPLRRRPRQPAGRRGPRRRDEGDGQGLRQPDARRARALRPGAAGRRRLLAPEGVPRQGRLRAGRRRDAAGRRHALALAGRPCRSRPATASPRASRWPCATSTATCSRSSTSRRSTPTTRRPRPQGAYGSTDAKHPSVAHLNRQPGHYAAGRLEVIRTPPHYDFVELRRTPAELRDALRRRWAGPRSSPSRPATRCTAPTRS